MLIFQDMVEQEKTLFDMLCKNEKTSKMCEKLQKIEVAFPRIYAYNDKAI